MNNNSHTTIPAGPRLIRVPARELKPRAIPWLWKNHIARSGRAILTGLPGVGKSQVQCSYIAHVTKGTTWPDGGCACKPGRVLMLTAEDNLDDTVIPRLLAADADLDMFEFVKCIREENRERWFLLAEDYDLLRQTIRDIQDLKLVTIDPITSYLGGKLDSHMATQVRDQLNPPKAIAEGERVAISVVTHPPKRPGPQAQDHYIGSQAFFAIPRVGHICSYEYQYEDGKLVRDD